MLNPGPENAASNRLQLKAVVDFDVTTVSHTLESILYHH